MPVGASLEYTIYPLKVSHSLSWTVDPSKVCRDVDPLLEGLMLGLAVSPDNRTAAAFTSINQIVVLDVMLGTFRLRYIRALLLLVKLSHYCKLSCAINKALAQCKAP